MKVLIIPKQTFEGVLLSTPIIRAVNTSLNDCQVSVLIDSNWSSVLNSNIYIHSVYHNSEEAFKNDFDKVVDLGEDGSRKKKYAKKATDWYSFFPQKLEKWLFVNLKINRFSNKHVVDQYFDLLESLNVFPDELGIDFFLDEKDHVDQDWLPETYRSGFIVICLDAAYETRRLPYDRIIELCDRINKPIILLGTEEDFELGKKVESFFFVDSSKPQEEEILERDLNKKSRVFNACGKFSLNQRAHLIKECGVLFSFDNGWWQVGAAFQKKCFTIWGNTHPAFGNYPYRTKFVIFENNKLKCRPCSPKGYEKCPKGHFDCMNKTIFDFYLP
ncbi:MAG: glycosyltransferase family 9 protein [Bacteroidota bacterium]